MQLKTSIAKAEAEERAYAEAVERNQFDALDEMSKSVDLRQSTDILNREAVFAQNLDSPSSKSPCLW